MNDVKTYNVRYYQTTRDEVTKGKQYVESLIDTAYNASTLAQVTLAQKAYEMDERLFNKGVDKFMFRRDLDNYVSNPNNGVVLRKLSEYNRFLPAQLTDAVKIVEQYKGEVLVLSFQEEVVEARPRIHNSLLADRDEIGSYYTPQDLSVEVEERKISIGKSSFDPILFGILKGIKGEIWEKVWILGAWINYYPFLTTSESIVAAVNNKFSLGSTSNMKMDNNLQPKNFGELFDDFATLDF